MSPKPIIDIWQSHPMRESCSTHGLNCAIYSVRRCWVVKKCLILESMPKLAPIMLWLSVDEKSFRKKRIRTAFFHEEQAHLGLSSVKFDQFAVPQPKIALRVKLRASSKFYRCDWITGPLEVKKLHTYITKAGYVCNSLQLWGHLRT